MILQGEEWSEFIAKTHQWLLLLIDSRKKNDDTNIGVKPGNKFLIKITKKHYYAKC